MAQAPGESRPFAGVGSCLLASSGSPCTIVVMGALLGWREPSPSSPGCKDKLLADVWLPQGHLEKVTMSLDHFPSPKGGWS